MAEGLAPFLALPILSVIFFCLCSLQFLRTVRQPIPAYNTTRYNRTALRFEKGYKVFAWGSMMGLVLIGLVVSFIEVYTRL